MRTVFVVKVNADLTEGRGPMLVKHICADLNTANNIALREEPYGHANQFTQVEEMDILTSYPDYEKQQKEKLIKSALGKLSQAERKALNLE